MNIDTLQLIAILVSVVGGLKALEWVVEKITSQHDKAQKIDTNAEDFEKYKEENDKKIAELEKSISNAHKYAQDSLEDIKKEIVGTISEHRDEYLEGIKEVKQSITEMSSVYQQTVAIIELKIDNLEKKQDKHNNVIARTYELEKNVSVLENREKVTEHRLDDLERKTN